MLILPRNICLRSTLNTVYISSLVVLAIYVRPSVHASLHNESTGRNCGPILGVRVRTRVKVYNLCRGTLYLSTDDVESDINDVEKYTRISESSTEGLNIGLLSRNCA